MPCLKAQRGSNERLRNAKRGSTHQLEGKRPRYLLHTRSIPLQDRLDEVLGLTRLNEIERTPTKATAHHSPAETGRVRLGQLHKEIELRTADLVVVSEALMRLG